MAIFQAPAHGHITTVKEIIARETQSQHDTSGVTEDDNGDEKEDVAWEMSPPRKDEIRLAFEVSLYCLF